MFMHACLAHEVLHTCIPLLQCRPICVAHFFDGSGIRCDSCGGRHSRVWGGGVPANFVVVGGGGGGGVGCGTVAVAVAVAVVVVEAVVVAAAAVPAAIAATGVVAVVVVVAAAVVVVVVVV